LAGIRAAPGVIYRNPINSALTTAGIGGVVYDIVSTNNRNRQQDATDAAVAAELEKAKADAAAADAKFKIDQAAADKENDRLIQESQDAIDRQNAAVAALEAETRRIALDYEAWKAAQTGTSEEAIRNILNGGNPPVAPPPVAPPPTTSTPVYVPPTTSTPVYVAPPPVAPPPVAPGGRRRRGGAKNEAAILKMLNGGCRMIPRPSVPPRYIEDERETPVPPPPSAPSQESLEAAIAADNETRMSLEKSMEATRGVPDAGPPYKAEVLMDGSSYILDRNNTVIVVSKTRMEPMPHHGNFPRRSLDELYREGVARAEQAIKELTARYTTQPPPPPPPPPPIPTGREIYNLFNPPIRVSDPRNYGAPGTSSTTYYSGQSREEEMRRRAAAAAAAAERDRLERERRKRVATFVPPRPPAFTPLPSPVRPGFVQLTGRPALLRRRGGGKNEKAILKMLNAM
jgi:hypothetical protein